MQCVICTIFTVFSTDFVFFAPPRLMLTVHSAQLHLMPSALYKHFQREPRSLSLWRGICHTSTVGATTSFLKHRLSIFSQRAILGELRSDTQPLISITPTYKQAEPALTVHVHPSVRLPGLLFECLTSAASRRRKRGEGREREKQTERKIYSTSVVVS